MIRWDTGDFAPGSEGVPLEDGSGSPWQTAAWFLREGGG